MDKKRIKNYIYGSGFFNRFNEVQVYIDINVDLVYLNFSSFE